MCILVNTELVPKDIYILAISSSRQTKKETKNKEIHSYKRDVY